MVITPFLLIGATLLTAFFILLVLLPRLLVGLTTLLASACALLILLTRILILLAALLVAHLTALVLICHSRILTCAGGDANKELTQFESRSGITY